jgi:hypothetical protein
MRRERRRDIRAVAATRYGRARLGEWLMDDFFGDDPLDITSPEGIVLAAGSGILDDERRCECHVDCGCERTVAWPDDECEACRDDRHRDPSDPDDRRGGEWP